MRTIILMLAIAIAFWLGIETMYAIMEDIAEGSEQ